MNKRFSIYLNPKENHPNELIEKMNALIEENGWRRIIRSCAAGMRKTVAEVRFWKNHCGKSNRVFR